MPFALPAPTSLPSPHWSVNLVCTSLLTDSLCVGSSPSPLGLLSFCPWHTFAVVRPLSFICFSVGATLCATCSVSQTCSRYLAVFRLCSRLPPLLAFWFCHLTPLLFLPFSSITQAASYVLLLRLPPSCNRFSGPVPYRSSPAFSFL